MKVAPDGEGPAGDDLKQFGLRRSGERVEGICHIIYWGQWFGRGLAFCGNTTLGSRDMKLPPARILVTNSHLKWVCLVKRR